MQIMVFTGRLAADPQLSDDFGKATFRLIEKRGVHADGRDRLVGVNCVSWSRGLNEKVIGPGLAKGCEVVVTGVFVDTAYETQDGQSRAAKELVTDRLTLLDWAGDRGRERMADTPPEVEGDAQAEDRAADPQPTIAPAPRRRAKRAA